MTSVHSVSYCRPSDRFTCRESLYRPRCAMSSALVAEGAIVWRNDLLHSPHARRSSLVDGEGADNDANKHVSQQTTLHLVAEHWR